MAGLLVGLSFNIYQNGFPRFFSPVRPKGMRQWTLLDEGHDPSAGIKQQLCPKLFFLGKKAIAGDLNHPLADS